MHQPNTLNTTMPTTYDQSLRSKEWLEVVELTIINRTGRPVDILWINYDSELVKYQTLRRGEEFEIDTFKTHPWIFRDWCTGLLMHVNHKEVLWPESSKDRQIVNIHLPLQSLKALALWTTVVKLRNINEITRMELPQTLHRDLETVFRQFYNHHVMLAKLLRQRQNR